MKCLPFFYILRRYVYFFKHDWVISSTLRRDSADEKETSAGGSYHGGGSQNLESRLVSTAAVRREEPYAKSAAQLSVKKNASRTSNFIHHCKPQTKVM